MAKSGIGAYAIPIVFLAVAYYNPNFSKWWYVLLVMWALGHFFGDRENG